MSLTRDLFSRNTELVHSWSAVAHSDWFASVITHARAELMYSDLKTGELEGARKLERILLELAEVEVESVQPISSGINHNLDVVPRQKKTEPKAESQPEK